jgi:hypothetical protein
MYQSKSHFESRTCHSKINSVIEYFITTSYITNRTCVTERRGKNLVHKANISQERSGLLQRAELTVFLFIVVI